MIFSALTLLGIATTALALPSNMSPARNVIKRQFTEIPDNALYLIEWWPRGCGNGDGHPLTGGEETLAACVNTESLWDEAPPDSASVRFLFPDDGRHFQWKLFGTNDCSKQIAQGDQDQCVNVPTIQKVGAVIVYT